MGKPKKSEITYGPHKKAYLGEQHIGHVLGEKGFLFVDGPSGGGGHGLTAPGFDGVAYNPKTQELIIYDNKAYRKAADVTGATAIDPEVNLRKNLDDLINHIATHPNLKSLPHRQLIMQRLRKTRAAVADWILKGKPEGGLKLHSKVKLVVTGAWGNSTGIAGKLARSGAIEFLKLDDAPAPRPSAFLDLELDRLARQAEDAAEAAVRVTENRMTESLSKQIGKEAAQEFHEQGIAEVLAQRLKRLAATKTAKRVASLVPVAGWGFAAKDAYSGAEDIIDGHVWRGLRGIGLSIADVASDLLHLGDLVSGVGGTAVSLGVQGGTIAGQIQIEMERAEEKMQELMKEIEDGRNIPLARLREHYDLDDDAIKELQEIMNKAGEEVDIMIHKSMKLPSR
jgi:hypothetical protein